MPTLFIDAGNTFVKMAEYSPPETGIGAVDPDNAARGGSNWNLVGRFRWEQQELEVFFSGEIGRYTRIVLVSVRNNSRLATLLRDGNLQKNAAVTVLDHSVLSKHNCSYKTPKTLGMDRFFACAGALNLSRQYGRHSGGVLVTDAGTACTIDFMNESGVFAGGVIMPGLRMMSDTINSGAENLFETRLHLPDAAIPDTTEKAIQTGTYGSFIHAWNAHVEKILNHYPQTLIWVTGGDAGFIRDHSSFKVTHNPYLVFEGMRIYLGK